MCKRFKDNIFVVWTHDTAMLPSFLGYLNNINDTVIHHSNCRWRNGLEFLDLKIEFLNGKLHVDVYSNSANSFTYVTASKCYPMKKMKKSSQWIALGLRRICDTTKKQKSRADVYKK